MRAKLLIPVVLMTVAALLAAEAQAQSGSRGSGARSGGFGTTETNRIRQQAVGSGFSVASVTRQSLNAGQGFLPRTGPTATRQFDGFRQPATFGNRQTGPSPTRPFSGLNRRPSISPFLGLFQEGFDDDQNALAFQTIVRPQLEQQRINQQTQLQQQQLQSQQAELNFRVQQLGARPAFNPSGSQTLIPTGAVPSTFRFFGNYYPTAR